MTNNVTDSRGEQNEGAGIPASGRPTERLMGNIVDAATARAAAEAVELLEIKPFFNAHMETIFTKLEECDSYAQSADFNGDMMFIALSLPVINGMIHIASNRKALNKAMDWVISQWKEDPDRISILSALTLIYTATKGLEKYGDDPQKQAVWKRITSRVQKLSTETLE